jgi:2-polyprenyl-3-methyl-5-hydroxy-6-metoxy-1,4-benzoquinol methylase
VSNDRPDVVPFDGFSDGRVSIALVELLPDDELRLLNRLLPWAAFVVDQRGRRFGDAWSASKRNDPQKIPDPRIVELDRRFPLRDRAVLEIGCFEGIHTVALAQRAARLVAVDSRIENVVKTIVRCAMFGVHPLVLRWDVEGPAPPPLLGASWDVVHHVGVLYHLTDPVDHLRRISPLVKDAIMLDTHIAPDGEAKWEYQSGGRRHRHYRYREGGRAEPFAGMADHAKWLILDDLKELLSDCGFRNIDVASLNMERNGPRALIYANR